MKWKFKQT